MKRILISLLNIILLSLGAFSQRTGNFIKPPALGFYFVYHDFSAADYIRRHSLSAAFHDKEIANLKNMDAGLAIGYLKGLSNHFDLSSTLAASSVDYIYRDGQSSGANHLLLELDASVMAKLLTDRSWISPYVQAGLGMSKYQSDYGVFIPAGIGLQFVFFGEMYLLINAQYRVPVTALANYHLYYSAGLAGNIGKRRKIKAKPKPPVPVIRTSADRDRDGIADSLDACPDLAGLREFHGCPDRDGDGIPDPDDRCPTVPGFARYNGCPVPDTDGDGTNDEEDKCLTVAGPKSNYGCPLVQSDIEKRISLAAKNIFFITGSYQLSAKSYQPLNEVVKILKDNPALQLDIEGHTDDIGGADKNQLLSENRANAVADYLQRNGISGSRLHTKGYGESMPVADNKTTKGRAANRRVVFALKYY